MLQETKQPMRMRVLFLTLEFLEPTLFSGSGVYARTLVRLLLDECDVFVVCGVPVGQPSVPSSDSRHGLRVRAVTLPVWHKLGRSSSWEDYVAGAALLSEEVQDFAPDVVIGVDWSGAEAFRALRDAGAGRHAPLVYLNFRVHAESTGNSPEDCAFYRCKETSALKASACAVALSQTDADLLRSMWGTVPSCPGSCLHLGVISPPLRDEVRRLALDFTSIGRHAVSVRERWWSQGFNTAAHNAEDVLTLKNGGVNTTGLSALPVNGVLPVLPTVASQGGRTSVLGTLSAEPPRRFLTCCSRLCVEKNVLLFVEVVERLASFLRDQAIVPLLVGSPTDPAYAHLVISRLKRAFPGDLSVVSDFVEPQRLASMFQQTLLNVHPALYEAYGMTIAEAAAFGAPTLMDGSGGIGVADRLQAPRCAFLTNMRRPAAVAAVARAILRPGPGRVILRAVGKEAQCEVLKWDTDAVRSALVVTLNDAVRNSFRGADETGSKGMVNLNRTTPPTSDDEELDDNAWPWLEMVEWAASQCADGVVLSYDVEAVRRIVGLMASQPPYELATELVRLASIEAELIKETELGEIQLQWAKFLLDGDRLQGSTVAQTRYRLVPSRMKETSFWQLFFREANRRIQEHLSPRAAIDSKTGVSVDDQKVLRLEVAAEDMRAEHAWKPSKRAVELVAKMERLVQRDENGRSIAGLIVPGSLLRSAVDLVRASSCLVLTGFPCACLDATSGNITPVQDGDGPPGAVAIAKAVYAIGSRVVFLIEHPYDTVLEACIEIAYPSTRCMLLGSGGATANGANGVIGRAHRSDLKIKKTRSFASDGRIRLEVFPHKELSLADKKRLALLLEEASAHGDGDSLSHAIAIGRVGPCDDGRFRSLRGNAISSEAVAPLHCVIEKAFNCSAFEVKTTGIGDGGNEVGMGTMLSAVRSSVPMGGRIACVVQTHNLLACSVSNWGGYALAAAIAVLAADLGIFSSPKEAADAALGSVEDVSRILEAAAEAGACDSVTGVAGSRSVDGLPFSKSVEVFRSLRKLVLEF